MQGNNERPKGNLTDLEATRLMTIVGPRVRSMGSRHQFVKELVNRGKISEDDYPSETTISDYIGHKPIMESETSLASQIPGGLSFDAKLKIAKVIFDGNPNP